MLKMLSFFLGESLMSELSLKLSVFDPIHIHHGPTKRISPYEELLNSLTESPLNTGVEPLPWRNTRVARRE
jgi:hypothetical protein